MATRNHPLLLALLLLATLARTILGAPCCMELISAQGEAYSALAEHAGHDHGGHDHAAHQAALSDHNSGPSSGHEGHGGDNTANPCCSACGPTLPPEIAPLNAPSFARVLPEPEPVRALKTRPPYPAYEARGPPALI